MIDIIIVNWNSGSQLAECLNSLKINGESLISLIVVVDNASTDNSLSGIDQLGLPLALISNRQNRGFAAACNQGAILGGSDYLLFLNPDTRLFNKSLLVPLTFMSRPENSDVGICGIQLVDESGKVARSCARYPSLINFIAQSSGWSKLPWFSASGVPMSDWDHAETREVDHVIGAFYLVRRTVFGSLNGFDERFFVYLEDLDFSLRANKAGWRSFYVANARAFHAEGGTSRQVKAARLFYSLRSRLLYGFKHFPIVKAWLLILMTLAVELWSRLVLASLRFSGADFSNTLRAYLMLVKDLSSIISMARKRRVSTKNITGIP